jgi:septum formation protein
MILASTSAYRKSLLQRLGLPFETEAPGTDETPQPGEEPAALAMRLSMEKAKAVAARFPSAIVIGSDQVACMQGQMFGKPGNAENAIAQLERLSGQNVVFHTGLALLRGDTGSKHLCCIPTEVRFRSLLADEIRRYVAIERPFHCAGSAKSEGLGISLLEAIHTEDPTALIGLPLIALSRFLRAEGVCVP